MIEKELMEKIEDITRADYSDVSIENLPTVIAEDLLIEIEHLNEIIGNLNEEKEQDYEFF